MTNGEGRPVSEAANPYINTTGTTQSPRGLANLGWKICGDLYSGRSQDVEANRVYAYNTGLGADGSRAVVTVAVADLCPGAAMPHYVPPGYQPTYNLP